MPKITHMHMHMHKIRGGVEWRWDWGCRGYGVKAASKEDLWLGSSLKVYLWGKFPFISSPSCINHSASKAQVVFLFLQTIPA